MHHLLLSRRLRIDLSTGKDRVSFGAAHYSYGNVADKFQALFRENGILYSEILRPEIFVPPLEATRNKQVHLIFKPFDEIRVLHGARNIVHVAWEFEKISTRDDWLPNDPRHSEPFQDYVAMMKCVDEVWVGSTFAATVIKRYGIANTRVVPAPIMLPRPSMQEVRAERASASAYHAAPLDSIHLMELTQDALAGFVDGRTLPRATAASVVAGKQVFLTIANHADLRKNFPALLDGFSLGAGSKDAVLILKLVMDNQHVTRKDFAQKLPDLYRTMGRHMGEVGWRNIFVTSDFLTNEQIQALYLYADFYLSPALAEGQNLPILEAMARGVVPICGRHTAMLDYASDANAVIIPSHQGKAPQAFRDAYGIEGLNIDFISAEDVAAAVATALELSDEVRRSYQDRGWAVLASAFSHQAVAANVVEALGWQ